MVQGTIKAKTPARDTRKAPHSKKQASKVSKTTSTSSSSGGGVGKGKKKKKQKAAAAAAADKAHRKFTAGLTAKTEQLLGERVGHLELLAKPPTGKVTGKKAGGGGGSKKFG
ncbi:hypothetical protein XA68_11179 [Ophiocordyceps unilateralis]|uniref:Uncharacterized protein n=1 Tax=Ophiocordyceps unilateralis TaxID=268505 RepID=A0A2A9PHJ2_OPHUN|nr:hypothetical protein XA68_11179 [Ophiocordyceps unilateralis]